MAETTNPAYPEHAVLCPLSLCETEDDAITYWRHTADHDGLTPAGPLTVILVPVPDEDRALYGSDQCWRVAGEVIPKAAVAPLPTFVPSTEAVEQAAKKIRHELDPSIVEWDDTPGHVKNYWCRVALVGINAAAQHLVADSARHLTQYASSYGAAALVAQPQLAELHTDLRKRLEND